MAQTDKLRKYKSLYSSTLSSGISTGTGDTITPASVSGLPTDTEITLTFDRVDSNGNATPSKLERITGTISGGNLINYTRAIDGTTEQAHSSGAVIEMIWNADDWNDAVDWGLVEHNQDGTHGAVTATSVTTDSVTAEATNGDLTLAGNGTGTVKKPTEVQIVVVDFTTDLSTGDGKFYFHVGKLIEGMNLTDVHAEVITAGTTGTTDIQIHNVTQAADMLTTKLTIDSAETGSDTAATAAVIDTANDDVAENDVIRIDVDAVSTTAPKGLIVTMLFESP